jgi:hypothetical protein
MMPRAWVVHEIAAIQDRSAAVPLLNDPSFDWRRKAITEAPAPSLEACEETHLPRLVVREPRRVVIHAQAACRGLLVLSDTYAPGWRARVNGAPARILETNGFLRGVVIDRGASTIEFAYLPASLLFGGALTAAGILLLLLVARFLR